MLVGEGASDVLLETGIDAERDRAWGRSIHRKTLVQRKCADGRVADARADDTCQAPLIITRRRRDFRNCKWSADTDEVTSLAAPVRRQRKRGRAVGALRLRYREWEKSVRIHRISDFDHSEPAGKGVGPKLHRPVPVAQGGVRVVGVVMKTVIQAAAEAHMVRRTGDIHGSLADTPVGVRREVPAPRQHHVGGVGCERD